MIINKKVENVKILNCLFVSVLFILFGCNIKNESTIHKEYYENGKLKATAQLFNNKKNGLVIHYYENGNMESSEKYVNDTINGEVLSFYETGYLEKKSIMKMGITDGVFYTFYSDGSIKEFRKWVNGKMEGYGEDYWQKEGNIKAVYFARNDTLVYRRLFDTLGNVIKTEGDVPIEPNKKVN